MNYSTTGMKIAIQGDKGSFHELAAHHWFGPDITLECCDSFSAVFESISSGTADAAVCAVENSMYGSINEVYDLLQKHDVSIVGEINERIHQNLITLPSASLKSITHIFSHPVALAQCQNFLDESLPHAELIQHHDTAASVEYIAQQNNPHFAAIASANAASLYSLPILKQNIEDVSTNFTRFLVLRPRTVTAESPIGSNKTSLIIKTDHSPGALYRTLGVFADHNVNITKLQSRPIVGTVFTYQFYVDVETAEAVLKRCIQEITSRGSEVIELGSYVAATTTFED